MSSYTAKIDLTSKAQEEKRQSSTLSLQEPVPSLPEASLESLPDSMQDAVRAMGWSDLMPVQAKAIPYILGGRDIIVQSRTGSGKTGAFLLPLLELVNPDVQSVQVLILTPTRELARQVENEMERMRQASPKGQKLKTALVYGGVRYGPQVNAIKDGAQILVGTPGRILDHLEKRTLSLDALGILIMDEADEMLSMGFYPAMRELKRYIPRDRRSYMFSATIPTKVQRLAEEFLHNHGFLSLSVGQVHVDAMAHRYFLCKQMEKDRLLATLMELENPDSAIIFANTKREVEYLAKFLRNYGFNADEISGDLTQDAREAVMDRVRKGNLRFLVATDVAARGIDISDLSHVFLYDVPQDPEYYIHRAGRTARAGKTGVAITLATPLDDKLLLSIARKYDIDMEKREIPTQEEVEERVGERLTVVLEDRLRDRPRMDRERMQRFLPLVGQLAENEPEILAMLLDELYQETLHEVPDTPEVSPERLEKPRSKEGRGRSRQGSSGRRRKD